MLVCLPVGGPVDNEQHPDNVPTLNLPIAPSGQGNSEQKLERFRRAAERDRKEFESSESESDVVCEAEIDVGSVDVSCQINMDQPGTELYQYRSSKNYVVHY